MVILRAAILSGLLVSAVGPMACRSVGIREPSTQRATIFAFDRTTGSERWHTDADANWIVDVTIDDTLLVLGYDACPRGLPVLTSYDPGSGRPLWTKSVLGNGCGSRQRLSAADGVVAACTPDEGLTIIDEFAGIARSFGQADCADELVLGSATLVAASVWSGEIRAFDLEALSARWETTLPELRGVVAIGEAVIVAHTGELKDRFTEPQALQGIDARTGQHLWTVELGILGLDPLFTSSDGVLVVGVRRDTDGGAGNSALLALDLASGAVLWSQDATQIGAVDAIEGVLYAVWDSTADNEEIAYLDVLDIRSGLSTLVHPDSSLLPRELDAHGDGVAMLDGFSLVQIGYGHDLDPIPRQQQFPRNRVLERRSRSEVAGLAHLAAGSDSAFAALQGVPNQQDY